MDFFTEQFVSAETRLVNISNRTISWVIFILKRTPELPCIPSFPGIMAHTIDVIPFPIKLSPQGMPNFVITLITI